MLIYLDRRGARVKAAGAHFSKASARPVRSPPGTRTGSGLCLALAFACNLGLQGAEAVLLPGALAERLTVGLILGNSNVGLVWSALGAAASPRMALFFAATQLPIYLTPRLIDMIIGYARARKPS